MILMENELDLLKQLKGAVSADAPFVHSTHALGWTAWRLTGDVTRLHLPHTEQKTRSRRQSSKKNVTNTGASHSSKNCPGLQPARLNRRCQ
jgi:hypothetical protein